MPWPVVGHRAEQLEIQNSSCLKEYTKHPKAAYEHALSANRCTTGPHCRLLTMGPHQQAHPYTPYGAALLIRCCFSIAFRLLKSLGSDRMRLWKQQFETAFTSIRPR